jgi:fumarate hydratase class II
MPTELVHALASVKRAAARVNLDLGLLDGPKAIAITQAADEVLAGQHPTNSRWPCGRPAPAPSPT